MWQHKWSCLVKETWQEVHVNCFLQWRAISCQCKFQAWAKELTIRASKSLLPLETFASFWWGMLIHFNQFHSSVWVLLWVLLYTCVSANIWWKWGQVTSFISKILFLVCLWCKKEKVRGWFIPDGFYDIHIWPYLINNLSVFTGLVGAP